MWSDVDFEYCWTTGLYDDQPCCLCPHNEECSGSGEDDDDDDDDE